jgi:DNA-directed RNA polymerase specialized sigma24 family protein
MSEENAFRDLIQQVRAGNELAAAELVRTYEPAIRRAARIRLVDSRLQRLFDSIDISQSVFASFFIRAALGQYELEKPDMLLRLLVTMSHKKLADYARKQGAARRDYRRTAAPSKWQPVDTHQGPGEQAAMQELLQAFRQRLSAQERHLAEQRSLGRPWSELAAELGEGSEALRKKLTRAIDRAARELGLDEFNHG